MPTDQDPSADWQIFEWSREYEKLEETCHPVEWLGKPGWSAGFHDEVEDRYVDRLRVAIVNLLLIHLKERLVDRNHFIHIT